MYTILRKASITKLLVFTGVQVYVASSSTSPSQLAPIEVASVRDISTIVCYRQVLFVAATNILRFLEEENTYIFAASCIPKIPRIIYCACALTTI